MVEPLDLDLMRIDDYLFDALLATELLRLGNLAGGNRERARGNGNRMADCGLRICYSRSEGGES